jgi:membrane-bound lytic murein transglycosylase D
MKKHILFSFFVVILLTSCSSVKSQMDKKPSKETTKHTKKVEREDHVKKSQSAPEYTHEMAEADADDQKIKQETGDLEIDKDLKAPPKKADHFLLNKTTKRMEYWIEFFAKKNHDRFQRFIDNGEEYRPIIENVLASHGLPKELYFVGLIESGYYLTARSHAQAVGPWQFIRGTGKRYGLKITSEIDERQDIFKATNAAALYFKDLHNVFSSWELALSAYNAGEYGIIRRIMKHGTRDFYELSRHKYLPSETINYVPKVLAAMHIINNPEKYGFNIPKKKQRLFDLTHLTPAQKNLSLSVMAKRLNLSLELLKKLNPELKGYKTPRHFAGTYYLRVPRPKYSTKISEDSSLTSLPSPKSTNPGSRKEVNRRTAFIEKTLLDKPKFHKVKRGETLFSIAKRYDLSPNELASINGMNGSHVKIMKGSSLKLEKVGSVSTHSFQSSPKVKITNNPVTYKIRKGDNLTEIAKLFDVKLSKIKKVNRLKRSKVLVGQKIVLPDTRKGIYTVKKGDHLTKVAKDLKRPIEALIKLNSLKRGEIYPGQKIIVNMD